MDKQNSNDGNARNIGDQGSGSSMGKDLSKDLDHVGSKGAGFGDLDKAMEKFDKAAAPATAPAASSSQDKSSSFQSTSQDKSSSQSSSLDKSSTQGQSGSTFSGANIDKTVEKTATTAHSTIDKALGAAAPLAERMATSAHAGVDKVSNALSGVTGNMDEKTKQLTDAYGKFADSGREYVRTSPATSVAVALAAGYVLAKLFGGRR